MAIARNVAASPNKRREHTCRPLVVSFWDSRAALVSASCFCAAARAARAWLSEFLGEAAGLACKPPLTTLQS